MCSKLQFRGRESAVRAVENSSLLQVLARFSVVLLSRCFSKLPFALEPLVARPSYSKNPRRFQGELATGWEFLS
jgi:hypothetical protein